MICEGEEDVSLSPVPTQSTSIPYHDGDYDDDDAADDDDDGQQVEPNSLNTTRSLVQYPLILINSLNSAHNLTKPTLSYQPSPTHPLIPTQLTPSY